MTMKTISVGELRAALQGLPSDTKVVFRSWSDQSERTEYESVSVLGTCLVPTDFESGELLRTDRSSGVALEEALVLE